MVRHVHSVVHRGDAEATTLIVALHGCTWWSRSRRSQLQYVVAAIRQVRPDADVMTPLLPIEFWSLQDANRVVSELLRVVDRQWNQRAKDGRPYSRVVLVGFSFGSVLTRALYCRAAGTRRDGTVNERIARPWAQRVERIVLIAGLNRGWTTDSPVSRLKALSNNLGTAFAHLLPVKPTLFAIRRGAPFLTQTRLQWLALREQARLPALTIQLLGTRDDIVSPMDNIDLATGDDFLYLEVPQSGHFDVIQMGEDDIGLQRRSRFVDALTGSRASLTPIAVTGSDLLHLLPVGADPSSELISRAQPGRVVDDVVFVVHGIRDKGYWTRKVARLVSVTGQSKGLTVVAVAPSYGYFALLPFLLPWMRRDKVEWLLDMYVAVRSLYPDARVSFIGHSNGTYILAGAIESCRPVRFHNVVFAGSVVRSSFQWRRYLRRKQVGRVLNYVATADWVVAIFPRFLQNLKLQDVGGAGHDGFSDGSSPITDVEYVPGRHGAAIEERHWQDIAAFVLGGDPPDKQDTARHWLVVLAGHLAFVVWLFLGAVALLPLYALLVGLGFPELTGWTWLAHWQKHAATSPPAWVTAGALVAWLRVLTVALTRL
ncbi:MAG TPA: hypothetical protein VFD69_18565 [Vicinamibacterales bacterium]|nr:hypothetical protein [Vicinamibacterales bacterium]